MAKCVLCNKRISFLNDFGAYEFKDGKVCNACFDKIQTDYHPGFTIPRGYVSLKLPTRHSSELNELVEEMLAEVLPDANYVVGFDDSYARFDDNLRKVAMPEWVRPFELIEKYIVIDYDDIISYELIEDGGAVMSGGIGRAAIGGLMFGGLGAIVGSNTGQTSNPVCSSLQIKVTLNNPSHPTHYLKLIHNDSYKKSERLFQDRYQAAQDICAKLELIVRENEKNTNTSPQTTSSSTDPTEELRKYKALLDDGIITQEEFDQKKKQILGI